MIHIKGTKSNKKPDNQLLLIALFVLSMSTFIMEVFQSVAALFNFSSIAITVVPFVFRIGKMTSYSTIKPPFLINEMTE